MYHSKRLRLLALSVFVMGAHITGMAHGFRAGSIYVGHPVASASLPGQTSAAVYLTIENQGPTADRLLNIDSPAAQNVVVHKMAMNGQIMTMREVDDLPLEAQRKVELIAGSGYHLMMTGLKRPLVENDKIMLTLFFERAGKLEVTVEVEPNLANKGVGETAAPHRH